jgi:hypothetical protein
MLERFWKGSILAQVRSIIDKRFLRLSQIFIYCRRADFCSSTGIAQRKTYDELSG